MQRRHLLRGLTGSAGMLLADPAWAQERFPDRPIRIVVAFTAGGPTDLMARRLAERIAVPLGQPVIVENRTGAAGTIGAAEVARARADGYTLLVAVSSSHAIAATLMRRPTFDAVKDYAGVAVIGTVPMALAVHPAFPARTLQEFLRLAQDTPDGFNYGTSGAGGIAHLSGELFVREARGIKLNPVHYRGASAALQDLLANNIPMVMDTMASIAEPYRSGQVRILATFAEQRSSYLPDLPTAREQGMPGVVSNTYNAVLAPAGTPTPVLATLNTAVRGALADPAMQAFMASNLVEPFPDPTPERTMAFIRSELEKWRPVVQATGLSME